MTVSASMAVLVNGDPHEVPEGCDLARLVERLGHPEDGVATAVDGAFVARSRRREHVLRAGDQVHCFQLIVGG